MKSVVVAIALTAAMGGVVVLAGRDLPKVHHETVYLADAATTQPTTQPAKATNTMCLVNTEHEADPDTVVIHDGKAYAFCCDDCVAQFKANPSAYLPKGK
jgi:hypothetical protein